MTRLQRILWRGRVLLAFALAPTPLLGQEARVRVRETLRAQPNGAVIAILQPGTPLTSARTREGWVEVDVEGWVWLRSLGPTTSAGHDLVVTADGGENLRSAPSGEVLGRLERGMLLDERARVPGWVRVRRRAWMWGASLDNVGAPGPAAARASSTPAPAAPPTPAPRPAGSAAGAGAAILVAPGGDTVARVASLAELRVLAREGNWARVRIEGWTWLPPGDSTVDLTPVEATPAQLAAEPERYRGRVVSWELQFLSVERAERIRTEFFEGEPFLLTRHPAGGYVYVAIPPDRMDAVTSLLPLDRIRVVGRVRAPASVLTGSPILDLMELERARDRR